MSSDYIDAGILKEMIISGAYNLELNKEWINELNVFPVPDGDTGTNMCLTIFSAVNEINSLEKADMCNIAKSVSQGSLRGARGNSGVILSQLLRGFTREIQNYDIIDNVILSLAFQRAVETAYKAVMKPKEGTILTVARGIADKAASLAGEDIKIKDFLFEVIEEGKLVLEKTPDLLPVLKEASVVDSGGQGLIVLLEGAYKAFIGEPVEMPESIPQVSEKHSVGKIDAISEKDIKFGYCTEFIINISSALPEGEAVLLKKFLNSIGDSIVLVPDDDLIKIHVHTNNPGTVIQKALTYGELSKIKIDNMRQEHREILGLTENANDAVGPENSAPGDDKKKYGFVSVCAGKGFEAIFKDMGVDVVIRGGQTMNPSTDDFVNAINRINAENIFIFPNNKNIFMAANQAKELTKDKIVYVIPSKTVTQGISAMLNYDQNADALENWRVLSLSIENVRTSQITYSIRDTHVDDYEIKTGDVMAVGDSRILAVGREIEEVAVKSVDGLVDDTTELISVYYGEEYKKEDALTIVSNLEEKYPDCSVELIDGGQPVYYCIISVE